MSDEPRLHLPGAQRERKRHVDGEADGAPRLDHHRQEVRPVDPIDGPRCRRQGRGGLDPLAAPRPAACCWTAAPTERFRRWPWPRVTVQEDCRTIHIVRRVLGQHLVNQGPESLAMLEETGGALVSTGVVKSPGACRGGSFPRKSSCKTLVANDDNYAPVALAA